jgi:hypothetical protein
MSLNELITDGLEDYLPLVSVILDTLGQTESPVFHHSLITMRNLEKYTQNGPTNLEYLRGDMVLEVSLEVGVEDDQS